MMDLKELIKWLILCFNIVTTKKRKMDSVLTFLCLFLVFKSCTGMVVTNNRNSVVLENVEKNIGFNFEHNSINSVDSLNQSIFSSKNNIKHSTHFENTERNLASSTVGRTFGGPRVKKLLFSLVPVIFQLGAASTWALVSAMVGVKTLAVALVILKLMLLAAAAKFGAYFATKIHAQPHGWEPSPTPHKEIHLHIHNGHVGQEVHQPDDHLGYGPWNREGSVALPSWSSGASGPQTINTPYGHYVKVDSRALAPS